MKNNAIWCAILVLGLGSLALPTVAEIILDSGEGGPETVAKISVPAPSSSDAPPGPSDHLLTLKNGDRLHGVLERINGGEIQWLHPNVKKSLTIDSKSVRRIRLRETPIDQPDTEMAFVYLTNEDLVYGKLISMDAETLKIETPFAGRLDIKRSMVSWLAPGASGSGMIFRGPGKQDGWKTSGNIRFTQKGITGVGSAGRILDLPDRLRIRMHVTYTGRYPSIILSMYTDNLTSYSGNCYMVNISSSNIYVQSQSTTTGSRSLGHQSVPALRNKKQFDLEVLVDKKAKSFAVMLDGQLINQWRDSGEFSGKGNGITLTLQNQSYGTTVTKIEVTRWNGKVPVAGEKTVQPHDSIRFVNDDQITGTLLGLAGGKCKFKSEFATMDIPIDRIQRITMGEENRERARRHDGDIRLTYPNGEKLTIQLEEYKGGTLKGESENFGKINLRIGAFSSLKINIYDADADDVFDGASAVPIRVWRDQRIFAHDLNAVDFW